MKTRVRCCSLLILGAVSMAGCLLPAEAERPSLMVKASVEQSYEMTEVKRGTIEKTKTVVATYQQVKKEELSFKVNGKRIKAVYVEKGDSVKRGTLLAELRMDSEEEKLLSLEVSMEEKKLSKKHLTEQMELEKKQLARKKASLSEEEYASQLETINGKYRISIEDISDEIEIMEMEKEELTSQLAGGMIYAGMDGVVTQVSLPGYGVSSTAGKTVLTVSDSNVCAFECTETGLIPYFTVGETYVFTGGTKTYETVLAEANEETGVFRFEMKEPDASISLSLRVLYTLQTDVREDVLYLPKAAVHTANGNSYVYYIDEEGVRRMKSITAGLFADNEVEILDGLTEGEKLILR